MCSKKQWSKPSLVTLFSKQVNGSGKHGGEGTTEGHWAWVGCSNNPAPAAIKDSAVLHSAAPFPASGILHTTSAGFSTCYPQSTIGAQYGPS